MDQKQSTPILEIESLSVAYGQRFVLDKITLNVHPGEIMAVVGPNGAGKTTLIRTLCGLLQPINGSLRVAGQDLTRLSPKKRAHFLSVVPQARNLPGAYTVEQTVLMGRTPYLDWLGRPRPSDILALKQVLTNTQTADLADRRVGELSGGEQQRVLLARALAQSAPILLLDEPTAHLDLQYQSILFKLVSSAVRQQNLAVLLAAHDLNLVALYAHRVALLVEGHILSIGTPKEVLTTHNIEIAYHVAVNIIPHPDYGTPLILPDGHHPSVSADSVHSTQQQVASDE